MIKRILKLSALCILAGAIASLPLQASAQTTNKADKKAAASKTDKKPAAHPFHGKLSAIDKTAKTITVGKTSYQISSETKITKDGKPAMLEDGVIGDEVGGYVKPNDAGVMVATSVRFGPKPGAAGSTATDKKPAKTDKTQKQ